MHASAFDRYHAADSFIHGLDARVKVVATVLFILSNALLPDAAWLGFGLGLSMVVGVSLLAGLSPMHAVKRSWVALPFALAAITTLFSIPGQPLGNLNLGPWMLTITDAGLARFSSIVIRSLLSVQMAILLTSTTQFHDLIHALRHLRLPQALVAVISFMYRYLFVLSDEVIRLMRARDARSARMPGKKAGGSILWRAKIAGNMAGQLFIRSFERSDRVYNAMLARGYSGHLHTLNPHIMRRDDWLALAIALAAVITLQLLSRLI